MWHKSDLTELQAEGQSYIWETYDWITRVQNDGRVKTFCGRISSWGMEHISDNLFDNTLEMYIGEGL